MMYFIIGEFDAIKVINHMWYEDSDLREVSIAADPPFVGVAYMDLTDKEIEVAISNDYGNTFKWIISFTAYSAYPPPTHQDCWPGDPWITRSGVYGGFYLAYVSYCRTPNNLKSEIILCYVDTLIDSCRYVDYENFAYLKDRPTLDYNLADLWIAYVKLMMEYPYRDLDLFAKSLTFGLRYFSPSFYDPTKGLVKRANCGKDVWIAYNDLHDFLSRDSLYMILRVEKSWDGGASWRQYKNPVKLRLYSRTKLHCMDTLMRRPYVNLVSFDACNNACDVVVAYTIPSPDDSSICNIALMYTRKGDSSGIWSIKYIPSPYSEIMPMVKVEEGDDRDVYVLFYRRISDLEYQVRIYVIEKRILSDTDTLFLPISPFYDIVWDTTFYVYLDPRDGFLDYNGIDVRWGWIYAAWGGVYFGGMEKPKVYFGRNIMYAAKKKPKKANTVFFKNELEFPQKVSLYDITGRKVAQGRKVKLKRGIYFVKFGNVFKKIVVLGRK